jgi:hypothetical protein
MKQHCQHGERKDKIRWYEIGLLRVIKGRLLEKYVSGVQLNKPSVSKKVPSFWAGVNFVLPRAQ